jgi:hypothetical protein
VRCSAPREVTYLAAWCEVLALGVDALVVVDVVLPAVLGLVDVGESGVDTCVSFSQSHASLILLSLCLSASEAGARSASSGKGLVPARKWLSLADSFADPTREFQGATYQ